MTGTYFQGNKEHPQHISVGGILVNDKNEICAHYFGNDFDDGYFKDHNLSDFYILMRKTPEPNESLEATLTRGLQEEFGAKAEIVDYVGSLVVNFNDKNISIQKTTLYFLTKLISKDESLRTGDIESESKLEWQSADFLIPKMKEQGIRLERADLDESAILERVKKYLN